MAGKLRPRGYLTATLVRPCSDELIRDFMSQQHGGQVGSRPSQALPDAMEMHDSISSNRYRLYKRVPGGYRVFEVGFDNQKARWRWAALTGCDKREQRTVAPQTFALERLAVINAKRQLDGDFWVMTTWPGSIRTAFHDWGGILWIGEVLVIHWNRRPRRM